MLSRRSFLKLLVAALYFRFPSASAANSLPLDISSLDITVPAWLFDEKGKSTARFRAISVLEDKQSQQVVVEFESNRRLVLPKNTSVQLLMRRNNNRPTRKSILLKRTISYFMDNVFRNIAAKRQPEKGHELRLQFDQFQAQEIINKISIGAMHDLLLQLNRAPLVSSVVWEAKTGKFKVN